MDNLIDMFKTNEKIKGIEIYYNKNSKIYAKIIGDGTVFYTTTGVGSGCSCSVIWVEGKNEKELLENIEIAFKYYGIKINSKS